ncbi:MAG: ABC transporter permease [Gemmatimonadetes bacterium]|nr:ABC transporter permease [Gemmatimonadota bacterium]
MSFRDRYGDEVLETLAARLERQNRPDGVGRGRASTPAHLRELIGLGAVVVRLWWRRLPLRRRTGGRGDVMGGWIQDLRVSLRGLRRHPGFATSALVVVALGIGATTAIFSAVNSYFFRELPFTAPDDLVMLYETNPEFGWEYGQVAPANFFDWRERVSAFADMAAYSDFLESAVYVGQQGTPVLLEGLGVTGNFFSVLGVTPHLGRTFRFEETWAGGPPVVVVSHGLWTSQFGADPGIVGRTIELDGRSVEVVGVAPPGFTFPRDDAQLWYPVGWEQAARAQVWFRRAHWVRAVARLAHGTSRAAADAEFQSVVTSLQSEYPETNRVMGAGLMPVRDFLIKEVRRPLLILLASSAVLLLLACVNVANLMLLRGDDRRREVALRHALGARAGRVVRLMVTESVVIGLMGGVLGLALGWLGVRSMERLSPVGIDGATALALDVRVVVFALGAAGLAGVLFGLIPAARSGREGGAAALRGGARAGGPGVGSLRTSHALVALEMALAVLLVVGAGLLIRSYMLLHQVDPGLQTDSAVAVQFTIPSARYPSRDEVVGFYDGFIEALEGRAGIERAGVVGQLPLSGTSWSSQFQAEGWPPDRVGLEILHRRADEGYFEAVSTPVVAGRGFGPDDRSDGPLVVLVNETFVREHFPGEDPLGQRIAYDRAATPESTWYEIVGVVRDQHQVSPGLPPRAEVFEHRDQDWGRTNWVVVRTSGNPIDAIPTVRDVLREADPLIPVAQIRPLPQVWKESMAQETFVLTVLGVFGVLALLLAVVGVYTVSAQAARRRRHELGVRMALGADRRSVVSLVFRRAAVVVMTGLVAGLAVALLAGGVLRSQLFAIEPSDPATLSGVGLTLGLVGMLASVLPALRATRVDPVESLRTD